MAQGLTLNTGMLAALRDAVGQTIEEMGGRYENMVVLTADVDTSSRINGFKDKYPDRAYNMGIAEQNMISFAAGLAHEGAVPFAFTFGPFASMRACEQIRTDICYPNLPVRIIGNNAGYSAAESGCTHCALEDCAIASSFGNMTVIEPGDPFQIAKVLEATMHWDGPVYIRLGREAAASLYAEDVAYEIGKALVPMEGNDGAFICSGIVVHHAVEAAKKLNEDMGVNIRVVDMHTIKPLDREAVLSAAKTGSIVCAQDHNIIGGLGYAVAAALAEGGVSCQYKILGCPDKFVPIAKPDYLYHLNGYDAEGLYNAMKAML